MQVRLKFGCAAHIQDTFVGVNSCGHENHDKISKEGQTCGRVGPGGVFHNVDKVIDGVGDVEMLCPAGRNSDKIRLDMFRATMEQLFHGNFPTGGVVGWSDRRIKGRVEALYVVVERGEDGVADAVERES